MRKFILAAVVGTGLALSVGCCGDTKPTTAPATEKKPEAKPTSGCGGGRCGSAPETIPPAK